MRRITIATVVLVIGATVAWAQNTEATKQRQDAMQTVAKASLTNFKMMKGEVPLDLAVIQSGLKVFQEQMPKFKELFPDNSQSGGDTQATAKVWSDRAGFNQAIEKFIADSKAAASGIKDEDSFKKLYPAVVANCGGCHKEKDGYAPRLGESLKRLK